MSNGGIARVHYFERQFLRTDDFVTEQDYHLGMQRRHNIAQHTWGIVRGLELSKDKDSNVWVLPGLAVDGYGRCLILQEQKPLDTKAFDEKQSDALDVWLTYAEQSSDGAPKGYAGCGDSQTDAFYRWQENPTVRLEVPDIGGPSRRHPKGVPDGDLDYSPSRTQPVPSELGWPVFLGQVTRARQKAGQPYTYDVNLADRPYCGLVGANVSSPSGQARMQLEAETADDGAGFVVYLSDPVNKKLLRRLQIDPNGTTQIYGQYKVCGDLTLESGAVEFGAGAMPAAPRPWHMYHVDDVAHDPDNSTRKTNEFRIELPRSKDSQVVVGAWSENESKFNTFLSVDADGTVTVYGNLVVKGFIDQKPGASADVSYSDAAKGYLVASYSTAASSATQRLAQTYQPQSAIDLDALAKLLDTEKGRIQVVNVIVGDAMRRKAFVAALLEEKEALADAISALAANHANAVAEALVAHNTRALITALLANKPALESVLKDLLASPVGRPIGASELIAGAEGRQAVVNVLLAHPDQLQTFLTLLLARADACLVVVQHLIASVNGRQALSDLLLAHTDLLETFLNTLVSSAAGLNAVMELLLKTGPGRNAAVNSLRSTPEGRSAMVAGLTEKPEGRQAIASGILKNDIGRRAVVSALLKNKEWGVALLKLLLASTDSIRYLAGCMERNPQQLPDFAKLLAADETSFKELVTNLRSALCKSG